MKKCVILGLVFGLFALILVGCQGSTSRATVDEVFMNSLSTGLEARWVLSTNTDNQKFVNGSTEHREYYSKLVDAELNELSQYKDKEFENAELQALALEYIGLLDTQKDSLQYIVMDFNKYNDMWFPAFNKRSQLIKQFVNNYDLKVSDKYTATLNDMINNSDKVTADEQETAAVQAMLRSMQFVVIDDSSSWKNYQATVENTSGSDFTNFSLTINLMDGGGAILGTTYASVANWSNGQKANLEFSTDKQFVTTDLVANYAVK
ncbi:MAG: FxLYD domain-containing protein [Candidatus Cloacimonetes bacterium]|nr:FxLYD domain-containing protein [Candidatus Cloacimonadota bacterium]MDY0229958.1 FxLYD domain-containing protein [Candidatus Cloacimonadaceae bacterium]